jgi:hypothetical protein
MLRGGSRCNDRLWSTRRRVLLSGGQRVNQRTSQTSDDRESLEIAARLNNLKTEAFQHQTQLTIAAGYARQSPDASLD